MNGKAEVGVIGFIFLFIVFAIIWFMWLGGWVAEVGAQVVATNHLTGVEAFFLTNLNMVIMFAAVLGVMGYMVLVRQ